MGKKKNRRKNNNSQKQKQSQSQVTATVSTGTAKVEDAANINVNTSSTKDAKGSPAVVAGDPSIADGNPTEASLTPTTPQVEAPSPQKQEKEETTKAKKESKESFTEKETEASTQETLEESKQQQTQEEDASKNLPLSDGKITSAADISSTAPAAPGEAREAHQDAAESPEEDVFQSAPEQEASKEVVSNTDLAYAPNGTTEIPESSVAEIPPVEEISEPPENLETNGVASAAPEETTKDSDDMTRGADQKFAHPSEDPETEHPEPNNQDISTPTKGEDNNIGEAVETLKEISASDLPTPPKSNETYGGSQCSIAEENKSAAVSNEESLPETAKDTTTANNSRNSPQKPKVSPLIMSRHEWLEEQARLHQMKSMMSDEELAAWKAAQGLYTPRFNSNSSTSQQSQSFGKEHQEIYASTLNEAGSASDAAAHPQSELPAEVIGPNTVKNLAAKFTGVSPLQSPAQRPTMAIGKEGSSSTSVVPLNDSAEARQFKLKKRACADEEAMRWLEEQQEPISSNQSLDVSIDSLDAVDREYLGEARHRRAHTPSQPALMRLSSEVTLPHANLDGECTSNNSNGDVSNRSFSNSNDDNAILNNKVYPLADLRVADSEFLGFAKAGLAGKAEVMEFVELIKAEHPNATHIPYAWLLPEAENGKGNNTQTSGFAKGEDASGWDEDGEPEGSTGKLILDQVRSSRHEKDGIWLFPEEAGGVASDVNSGTVVVIVRYFGKQLLGVTCGRLTQCYQRIAQTALHRLFRGSLIPQQLDLTKTKLCHDLYGLAAGDTEVHLNVVDEDSDVLMYRLLRELDFGGFKGAQGEVLPRLQNLQADFYQYDSNLQAPVVSDCGTIIPVYRYPGNYQGDEWETFEWSSTSLKVKDKVESALPHFYNGQKMNHCVTNYYRYAEDHIAHHGDKDLDLDRNGAIVSISIGAERILELRRRADPRDITRVVLPHGSMLLLGPITNQFFTHSILPALVEDENDSGDERVPKRKYGKYARISLTLRNVTTFMDTKTNRLFGQGVECKTLQQLRNAQRLETFYFVLGFGLLRKNFWEHATKTLWLAHKNKPSSALSRRRRNDANGLLQTLLTDGVSLLGSASVAWWCYSRMRRWYAQRREERAARQFFTKASTSGTKY